MEPRCDRLGECVFLRPKEGGVIYSLTRGLSATGVASRNLTTEEVDRVRGFVEVANRRHVKERFPLMTLTIALVDTQRIPVTHRAELGDIAQELKAHGKGIPGSVVVGERRTRDLPDSDAEQSVA